jgi:hypothetical protein
MRLPTARTSVALTFALFASAVGAVLMVVAARWLVPIEELTANNDVAGSYLQTIGTVYAVLLAFVVFVVWNQHNEARQHVEAEANEISDLHRTVHGLREPCRSAVRASLRAYVRAVVRHEWAAMGRDAASPRAARLLDELWHTLERIEPSTSREEILYQAALDRFNELSDLRRSRLLSCRVRLPPTMWLLLLVGALLTTGSMAFFGMVQLTPHALMASALGILVCFVLFVIYDLDAPFWGDWCVSSEPIATALERPRLAAARPAPARRRARGPRGRSPGMLS